jgi:hypothetical protein
MLQKPESMRDSKLTTRKPRWRRSERSGHQVKKQHRHHSSCTCQAALWVQSVRNVADHACSQWFKHFAAAESPAAVENKAGTACSGRACMPAQSCCMAWWQIVLLPAPRRTAAIPRGCANCSGAVPVCSKCCVYRCNRPFLVISNPCTPYQA